jgi:hypothetical protein
MKSLHRKQKTVSSYVLGLPFPRSSIQRGGTDFCVLTLNNVKLKCVFSHLLCVRKTLFFPSISATSPKEWAKARPRRRSCRWHFLLSYRILLCWWFRCLDVSINIVTRANYRDICRVARNLSHRVCGLLRSVLYVYQVQHSGRIKPLKPSGNYMYRLF